MATQMVVFELSRITGGRDIKIADNLEVQPPVEISSVAGRNKGSHLEGFQQLSRRAGFSEEIEGHIRESSVELYQGK